jgi:hypothetical protein
MQTFYLTDTGKVREHNEDNVIILHNDKDEYVLAVADGMGGHRAGEVASAIVINCLTEEFYALDTLGDKDAAIDFLRDIVTSMNNKIFEYTKENPDSKGMGTTFVCAIKTKDYLLYLTAAFPFRRTASPPSPLLHRGYKPQTLPLPRNPYPAPTRTPLCPQEHHRFRRLPYRDFPLY